MTLKMSRKRVVIATTKKKEHYSSENQPIYVGFHIALYIYIFIIKWCWKCQEKDGCFKNKAKDKENHYYAKQLVPILPILVACIPNWVVAEPNRYWLIKNKNKTCIAHRWHLQELDRS